MRTSTTHPAVGTPPRARARRRTVLVALAAAVAVAVVPTVPLAPLAPAQAATVDPFTRQNDFNGDGKADMVVATPSGTLYLYRGTGASSFLPRVAIGTGWHNRDQIRLAGNFDSAYGTDVLAREPATGKLWLYRGSGTGTFRSWGVVGTGWNIFREIITPGDWNGDGKPDVIAVRTSDDSVWLYPGNGSGGWLTRRQIATGWASYESLTAVGDWNGDGKADLVARDVRNGTLRLFPGNGTGGFLTSRVIGTGWASLTAILGPGDLSGDGRTDIVGRRCQGTLSLYAGNGTGGFLPSPYPTIGGSGWTSMVMTWPIPVGKAVPTSLLGKDWEKLPTTAKVIALTFDGGSSDAGLASILSTLKATGTPATFFVTGDFVRRYPIQSACVAAAGYPIGNHSNTHADYTKLTDAQIVADLWAAEKAIVNVGAPTARPLFRFPYGARTSADVAVVNGARYVPVRWTVDSLGWLGTSRGTATDVVNRVVAAATPGGIVLMHVGANPDDGTTFDADALPQIIAKLRAQGYTFVTLDTYFG